MFYRRQRSTYLADARMTRTLELSTILDKRGLPHAHIHKFSGMIGFKGFRHARRESGKAHGSSCISHVKADSRIQFLFSLDRVPAHVGIALSLVLKAQKVLRQRFINHEWRVSNVKVFSSEFMDDIWSRNREFRQKTLMLRLNYLST